MMDIQITDEHLTKLEITKDSLLLLKVPREISREEYSMIRQNLLKRIREIIGIDPCLIIIHGEFEIALLDVEALRNLKAEIDAVIKKQSGG